jgi:hypothetical protein
VLCEECYRLYMRKFRHLMDLKTQPKPSKKFSEEGDSGPVDPGSQLSF